MRPLEQLIDENDPGWPLIEAEIREAKNEVEVLPADTERARKALHAVQVTTRSYMGAIVYATGGILVDHGWLRILGSGSERMGRSLADWNLGKGMSEFGKPSPFLVIADDAVGGFFLLNGGGLGPDPGMVYYLAPDTLEFESMKLKYSKFIHFCFHQDLDAFYGPLRFDGWQEEVAKLQPDQCLNFYPYLWSQEGADPNQCSRKAVPIEEQYWLNMDFRKQLGLEEG